MFVSTTRSANLGSSLASSERKDIFENSLRKQFLVGYAVSIYASFIRKIRFGHDYMYETCSHPIPCYKIFSLSLIFSKSKSERIYIYYEQFKINKDSIACRMAFEREREREKEFSWSMCVVVFVRVCLGRVENYFLSPELVCRISKIV